MNALDTEKGNDLERYGVVEFDVVPCAPLDA